MTCDEAEILLHALIDGELDAGHAHEVEAHIASCASCTAKLAAYRQMSQQVAAADLRFTAPASLRQRIDAALPKAVAASNVTPMPSRRGVLRGFALGSAVSAMAATGLVAIVLRNDDEQRIESEIVSAHLRSLQAGHLIDVVSSDQHTVKPWLSARLDVSPPVRDLKDAGFPLVGGRLDYVDGHQAAAVVYRRAKHVINLFAWASPGKPDAPFHAESQQGFNLVTWRRGGITYYAVSDVEADQLSAFARLVAQDA